MKTPNKMKGKSPMTKPLVGGQKNLNAGLRASIEASPLEAAKPDFLDLDKDGNTSEPMKGAAPKMNKKPGSAMNMKSGFKMKSGPMNMKVKGSVAKMAGVSPTKHKPWAEEHKEKSAHSATAEAHGKQPKYDGQRGKPVPGGGAASRPENQ